MACTFFRLEYLGEVLDLEDEPVGWDSISFKITRDKDWHGLNYEYSDGDIQLEFDCAAGGPFIQRIYEENGLDADIAFTQGVKRGNIETIEFSGRLVLSTFKKFKGRVSCSVERKSLHDIIKARFDTKVDLMAELDLDQKPLASAPVIKIETHSKTIMQSFFANKDTLGITSEGGGQGETPIIIYPYSTVEKTSIKGINQREFNILATNNPGFLWKSEVNGTFQFDLSFDWSFNSILQKKSIISDREYRNIVVKTVFEIRTGGGNSKFYFEQINDQRRKVDDASYNCRCQFNYSGSHFIEIGDEIRMFTIFTYEASNKQQILFYANLTKSYISINGNSFTPKSEVKGLLVYESLDRILNSITSIKNILISDFFGRVSNGYPVDGCGSKSGISNGFQLREFVENKGIEISLKTLIESLSSIYCLGMAYEYDETGNERMRLERREFFYRNKEILFIEYPSEYQEETAQELVFNNIEIGYEKYPDEGEQILDEFNTVHEYTSPIKRHDNKFSQISKLVASGYAIELTRRERYSSEGINKTSTKYDDDCFLIALGNFNGSDYQTEKNENIYADPSTLIDPSTAYNLRFSPKRMLLNWAKWLNGGYMYKDGSELIKNTFVKQNGELFTKTIVNRNCDIDLLDVPITESDNIALAEFGDRERIFIPDWVTFYARLSKEEITKIKNAISNKSQLGDNYGYISTLDLDGNRVSGWIYEMEWFPTSEKVFFKLLKYKVLLNNTVPPDQENCQDYADWTFEDFENSTVGAWIESCRFEDFN
ncbi:hypothetical protein BWD42_04020 [Sphingobacterium sp. CZ-UAM]|uniref:hypothetical protein n=1 Tax=Sphingobacterium sp. CZ-UAM TaxID=1933868 RepID=UPI000987CBAE|nr:hypothetical protein [Sphingobacterium sp. CZ-UAM]OOG19124.1 hypothetical protein BWD42_04020 [Sphingobacterium sp. CZ-UAM]